MAQDYRYTAFSDLQDLLTKRRLEARQDMLDQVGIRDTESQITSRNKQAEAWEEERGANAEWRRASAKGIENVEAGKVRSRETWRAADARGDFKGYPAAAQTALTMAIEAQDDDLVRAILTNVTKPDTTDPLDPWQIYDETDNKLKTPVGEDNKPRMTKRGTAPGTRNRPPQGPQPAPMQPFQGKNPDGTPAQFGFNPRTNRYEPSFVPNGATIDGREGVVPPPPKSRQVSSNEWINLAKLKGKATDIPGGALGFGAKPATEQDIAAYNQALGSILSISEASIDVVDTVIDALLREDPATPYADIIKKNSNSFSNPQEFEQFSRLLLAARGGI